MKCAFFGALAVSTFQYAAAQQTKAEDEKNMQTQKLDDAPQGPFFLVDETPSNTVKILESLTGKVAIQAPNLPNVKINFSTSGKLSRSEAIIAFKSLLAANGIAITPMGEKFFKAAPMAGSSSQAADIITGAAAAMPASQSLYTKLYELKYAQIDEFKTTLSKFVSADSFASVAVFSRKNAFLLTDTLVNHQRVETILKTIDTPTQINEDIGVVMLKNMASDELKRRFQALKGDILKKYFERTTIEADERTNQVIIATEKGNLENIKKLIEKLDVDAQPLTRSEVYYIRHGQSKDIETVLNNIVKGQKTAVKNAQTSKAAATNATNRNNAMTNAQARMNAAATQAKSVPAALPTNLTPDPSGAALQFSDYITIVADERSNAIVAYGTPTDLKQIEDIIRKVDIILAQVKIDVIITEVTLTDNQVSGLSSFGLDYSTMLNSEGKKGWSGNTAMSPLSDDTSSPFSLSIDEYGFSSIFGVATQNDKVKILSAPSIVTTHNNEATINVSQTQPIITSTTTYQTSSYPQIQSEVEWKDIGIVLKVTPRIGENGVVQMQIKQTVESVVRTTVINDINQPIIGKREAESFVSATSGETIILAGLQQTKTNSGDGEVFLLSDIPLIGNWFKPESEKTERTELIIFIRPTVIKSEGYESVLAKEKIGNSEVEKEVTNYFKTGTFHDPKNDTTGVENRKYSSFERTILPKSITSPEKYGEKKTEQEPQADAQSQKDQTLKSPAEKKSRFIK